jgi:hypothetical protein
MITIDDKQYEEADLTEAQKYMLAQIQDLDAKQYQLSFQKDQLQVAREAFSNALVQSIKQAEAEQEDPSSGDVEG